MADRTYIFAQDVLIALQNAQYTDDSPVNFSPHMADFIISDWDNIKLVDRTAINTLALAKGYTVQS